MAVYKGDCVAGFDSDYPLGTPPIYALRTVNDNSAAADRSSWELNAGASITFYFRKLQTEVSTTPAVTIRVYYETGTGTVVRTFLSSGAPPTSGTAYTFYATSDGTSGGSPRAGTVRLYLQVVETGTTGGLTDYNVDSDGTNDAIGTGWTNPVINAHVGVLRCNALCDLSVNSYPAGTQFANGETVTITASHTQPFAVRGHEDIRIDCLDGTAQQIAGAQKDVVNGTSTSQNFTGGSGFDLALKSYGAEFLPIGNAQLVPTSGAIKWSKFVPAGGGSSEANGNNVRRQAFYNVDTRDVVDLHTQRQDTPIFNAASADYTQGVIVAGQVPTWARVRNSRLDELNGISVTFSRTDPASVLVDTQNATTGPDATNGSSNGWTPRAGRDVDAPPGTWTYKAQVTRNGVTSFDEYAFTHITPVTSNLEVLLRGPVIAQPGSTVRFRSLCEIDDTAAVPEEVPVCRLFGNDFAELVALTQMRNVVNDAQTVNGSKYYADMVMPSTPGRYVFWSKHQLNGNGVRRTCEVRVLDNGFGRKGLTEGPE